MLREIVYRGIESSPRIEDALRTAVKRLERQVMRFDPGSGALRVVIAGHPSNRRYSVSARLTVRGRVIHAREERADLLVTIRRTFDDLVQLTKKHIVHLRHENSHVRRGREDLVLADDLARKAAREVQALRPLDAAQIERLQRFVRREAFYRRLDGRFPHGLSPDDVVDDTVVLALEEADEKPDRMPYEVWLTGLARRALDRRAQSSKVAGNGDRDAHVEWEAYEAGLLEPPSDDDWLTYFQPDEDPTVGDITQDPRVVSPEESLARQELQSEVHRILGQLPSSWRHAFTLYTIEGFEMSDVANSLEASSDQVLQQVALATEFLREKLRENGYSRDRQAVHSGR